MWRLVDLVSRMLEPDERDAVRGDFAESRETGGQALRDVLGLVVLRQAGLWKDWRPWLTLVGLVVPLGMLLSLVSRRMAAGSAIYAWLYLNNWDWGYVQNPGFRHDLAGDMAAVFMEYGTLICWSWTGGFVLGSLSRRTIWVNRALFCLALLSVECWGAPRFLGRLLLLPPSYASGPNEAVFSGEFYRAAFPWIIHIALVLFPSLWGMRQGFRRVTLPLPLQMILWASAAATMFALVAQNLAWWQVRTWDTRPPYLPHLPSLMPLAIVGPIGYMLASASGPRRRALKENNT